MRLNLVYHITTVDRPLLWYNLVRLKNRLPVFNGKKFITFIIPTEDEHNRLNFVTTDDRDASISFASTMMYRIKQFLGEDDDMVYRVIYDAPNVKYHDFQQDIVPLLQSTDSESITFRGHTKGVECLPTMREYYGMALWVDALYTHGLDAFADIILRLTTGYDAYGVLKSVPDDVRQWYYAGGFFWFRHDAVFSKWTTPSTLHMDYFLSETLHEHRAYSPFYLPPQFLNKEQLVSFGAWELYLNSLDSNVYMAIDEMNEKASTISL